MPNPSRSIQLQLILVFVGAIWGVFLLDRLIPGDLNAFGLVPRTARGLVGIPAMSFLHANLRHIISNTMPLLVLLFLVSSSNTRPWSVVITVTLVSGTLLWLFGRSANHIGASGLIFGLIGFLVCAGIFQRRLVPLAVSILVGFLYGGSLLVGIIPRFGSNVSWDGHLAGLVGGALVAFLSAGLSATSDKLPD